MNSQSIKANEATHYQTSHTYFFVPKSLGPDDMATSDDTNRPGAILRLGGYSDLEASASDSFLDDFYPAQYRDDVDSGKEVSVGSSSSIEADVFYSAGNAGASSSGGNAPTFTNTSKGILLAADGNILVRSGEKTYIQSVGAMHVDVDDALTVEADETVSVKSGKALTLASGADPSIAYAEDENGAVTDKNIYIYADNGNADIDQKVQKSTITIFGESTEKVTKDKYTYFQADEYKIQMGRITQIILGGKFHVWVGATLSIRLSIDVQIDILGNIKFWTFKFDFGGLKIDFYQRKLEFKEGKVSLGAWTLKKKAAEVEQDDVKCSVVPVESDTKAVTSEQGGVKANQTGVESDNKGVKNSVNGVTSVM